jgi:hypothetical protein
MCVLSLPVTPTRCEERVYALVIKEAFRIAVHDVGDP